MITYLVDLGLDVLLNLLGGDGGGEVLELEGQELDGPLSDEFRPLLAPQHVSEYRRQRL